MKRRLLEVVLLVFLAAVSLSIFQSRDVDLQGRHLELPTSTTTQDLAWRRVSEQLEIELFPLPTVAQKTTVELREGKGSAPAVLDELAGSGIWKVLDNKLLYVIGEWAPPPEYCSLNDFLLEEAPAGPLVKKLRVAMPAARFRSHPTMNGFYADSDKTNLLNLKRILGTLDRPVGTPLDDYELPMELEVLSFEEALPIVEGMYPELQVTGDDRRVVLKGNPFRVLAAQSLLWSRDCENIEVDVDIAQLEKAINTCKLTHFGSKSVACYEGCQGPLHLLGIKRGDEILQVGSVLNLQSALWICRQGRRYRLKLNPN
ncbi:MAG TPA: hypothetical protein EYO33_01185 [Phycisphaerales bacterium]|nr:hypothetical protein [Phycisphaerales bacterium]